MPLSFHINDENLGTFKADEKTSGRQIEEMRKIVGAIEGDETSLKKAAKQMKALIAKDPLFMRGYAMLAEVCIDLDDEAQTAEWHVKGSRAALKIIPEDFNGPMDLDNPDVQCFLRCHSGYVDSLSAKGEYKAAFAAARRHLAFDPEDMFDRGRDLGELAIMADEPAEAARILHERAEHQPTANYSLGYLALQSGEHAKAAAFLRRAFALAPYAADMITGRFTSPNIFWQQGPEPPDYQECLAYVESVGGEIWMARQEAREFLEWLSMTALAMGERAALAGVSEKCLLAEDGEEMKAAVAEREAILAAINEESSAKILRKVDDPEDGENMYPWQLYAKGLERMIRMAEEAEGDGVAEDDGLYEDEESEDGESCGCGHKH